MEGRPDSTGNASSSRRRERTEHLVAGAWVADHRAALRPCPHATLRAKCLAARGAQKQNSRIEEDPGECARCRGTESPGISALALS